MKLLKLTLFNLASLEGEQVIDFQMEPLKSSDLFSITGPTGSGKSTILDAICLALYGNCPRFKAASRMKFYGESNFHTDRDLHPDDVRNILSRGTKRCFTELLFLANDGVTYQARWSCEVGRTNYQKAVRKLYRLEESGEGIVVPNELEMGAKRADNETIDRLIGLSYDQFVRTVLLAQGSFANFIKADDKEKAKLLERLTGTEIYTTIAQKIYEFYKSAADSHYELDIQVKQLASQLLSEEEAQLITEEREQLDQRWKASLALQKNNEAGVQWWENLEQLETALTVQKSLKAAAVLQLQQLAGIEKELNLWDAVLPIQSAYTQLESSLSGMASLGLSIQQAASKKVECQTAVQAAIYKLTEAKEKHEKAKQLLETKSPLISEAKVVKSALEELALQEERATQALQATVQARQAAIVAVKETHNEQIMQMSRAEKAVDTLQRLQLHDTMLEELKVIGAELKGLHADEEAGKADALRLEVVKREVVNKQAKLIECEAELKELEKVANQSLHALNESKELVGKFQIDELHKEQKEAVDQTTTFERVCHLDRELIAQILLAQAKEQEVATFREEMVLYESNIERITSEKELVDKILPGLKEAYQLTVSESSESMRAHLQPDTACPVCGSKEHPYSEQNVVQLLSPLQEQIERSTNRLKQIEEELNHPQRGWKTLLFQADGKIKGTQEVLNQLWSESTSRVEERSRLLGNYSEFLAKWGDVLLPTESPLSPPDVLPLFQSMADLDCTTSTDELLTRGGYAWETLRPSEQETKLCEELLHCAKEQVKQSEKALADYARLQKESEKRQLKYDTDRVASEQALKRLNELRTAVRGEESTLEEQTKRMEQLAQQFTSRRVLLRKQITLDGWERCYDTQFDLFMDQLRVLYLEHKGAKEQKEVAERALKELATKLAEQEKMVDTHRASVTKCDEELQLLKKRLAGEQLTYNQLLEEINRALSSDFALVGSAGESKEVETIHPFNDESRAKLREAAELEQMLKQGVEAAAAAERLGSQHHQTSVEAFSRVKGNYEALLEQQKAEQTKQAQLTETVDNFISQYNQLQPSAVVDNSIYTADAIERGRYDTLVEESVSREQLNWEQLASLFRPDRAWSEKRKQLDEAKGEVKRLVGALQKCMEDLDRHQKMPHKPVADRSDLLQQLEALKQLQVQIDQERQVVTGKWVAHQQAFEKVAHFQFELKERRELYENWKLLNDILGNKDGDNFRETAQIYTLQFLLKQANAQLALLSKRYRLEQVSNSLSIRIVDRDRADEVRNLSSLSGGETFLVSLSLALGLSSLSSRNISIQNLFVDEGFGTLDADSLNMVIDALSSLHAMQGKKVGVISHTSEMKERIHTQIRVVKQGSGGRSLLEIG